jgi:hypothetical protein
MMERGDMIPAVDLLDEAEIARQGGEIALTKGENDIPNSQAAYFGGSEGKRSS